MDSFTDYLTEYVTEYEHWTSDRHNRAKASIAWHFFMAGLTAGNWVSTVPQIKSENELTNAELGGVMIACLIGSILVLPLIPRGNSRFGSGTMLLSGAALTLTAFPLVGADDMGAVVLGVFLIGVGQGLVDVSMNTQAVVYEAATGSPTTGKFHAMYALGSITGALIGGAMYQQGMRVFVEVGIFSAIVVAPQVCFSFGLYFKHEEIKLMSEANQKDPEDGMIEIPKVDAVVNPISLANEKSQGDDKQPDLEKSSQETTKDQSISTNESQSQTISKEGEGSPQDQNNNKSEDEQRQEQEQIAKDQQEENEKLDKKLLIHICTLAFLGYLGYGSIVDWSAVYLSEDIGCDSLRSTLGYVGFSICAAIGTTSSDRVAMRIGRRILLQYAGTLAASGVIIVVLAKSIPNKDLALGIAIIGFSMCGMGISVVPPSVISLAGSFFKSSETSAFVSSVGYVGMMTGPPLLGGMSSVLGDLRWSLVLDAAMMVSISVLASCLHHVKLQSYS